MFTGSAGIVTTDASGLEPGDTFVVAVQGRAHFDNLGSTSCYACKAGVLAVYPKSSGEITVTVTGAGTTTLDISTLTIPDTGSQTIIVGSDGTNLAMWVDGGAGMVAGDAQSVTDNANEWTWVTSDALDYVDQLAYDAGTGDALDIFRAAAEWNTGSRTDTEVYTDTLGLANG
jgi:hypothetical protein